MSAYPNHMSIVDAVEALSNIAELEFDHEVGVAQKHEKILGQEKVVYKTIRWLHREDPSATIAVVREIFRVILHYLKLFYKKEYDRASDPTAVERIKTVMVLVGEAARKLDKYTHIFHHTQSVTEFKEYKQLQEFYRHKVADKIGERALSHRKLESLTGNTDKSLPFKAAPTKTDRLTDTKRVFVDLESVKRDAGYELFFLRKEDGSRFFNPRLLRNMELLCDFGSYLGKHKETDPLEHLKEWQDRIAHTNARAILKAIGSHPDRFFSQLPKLTRYPLANALSKALIALMLASHARNLLSHHPVKSCTEYFADFQGFIREALQTEDYRKWQVYPPKGSHKLALDLMDLLHLFCRALYTHSQGMEEAKPLVKEVMLNALSRLPIEHPKERIEDQSLADQLTDGYSATAALIGRSHPNGPLLKIIGMLDEERLHAFDPLIQDNLPNPLFDLHTQERRVSFLRLATPVYQEFINKAIVNDEFKGFLQEYSQGNVARQHLLINLQDRTSWKEHVRCLVLEDLQRLPEMEKGLRVVTLAMDTDFYHQLAPYHQLHHAELFKEQFKELLLDANAGYYFPQCIRHTELALFIDQTFDAIHRLFFSSKNVLSRESRLDFIEIFYLFLELKLIEWLQPDSVSLTCKDGIDTGAVTSAALFILLKWMNGQPWGAADRDHLNFMLYAPALIIRERVILPERFHRMLSALRTLENIHREFGAEHFAKITQEAFSRIFTTSLLQAHVVVR